MTSEFFLDPSMMALFRQEVDTQAAILNENLLQIETIRGQTDKQLEACMRAAHSIKGASRIVGVDAAVTIAHVMEDFLVMAQEGQLRLSSVHIDRLLRGVDQLKRISESDLSQPDVVSTLEMAADSYVALMESPAQNFGASSQFDVADGYDVAALPAVPGVSQEEMHYAPPSYPAIPDETLAQYFSGEESTAGNSDDIPPFSYVTIPPDGSGVRLAMPAAPFTDDLYPAQYDYTGQKLPRSVAEARQEEQAARTVSGLVLPAAPADHTGSPGAPASVGPTPHSEKNEPEATGITPVVARESELRVSAAQLNKMSSLSGELMVQSLWIQNFEQQMLRIKQKQQSVISLLDKLAMDDHAAQATPAVSMNVPDIRNQLQDMQTELIAQLGELEDYNRRNRTLTRNLFDQVLECRRRPLADRSDGYVRMMRDLARSLNKKVNFTVIGAHTKIDRDVLDMLDAPLIHILRNAIDHGIEAPQHRHAVGKSETGSITLSAYHHVGALIIDIKDDGAGIDPEMVRKRVVARNMVDQATADRLSENELMNFLLLPGFSMREKVSEVSGRGVGLDVVHHLVSQISGTVKLINSPGMGMTFRLQLPLTMAVSRNLLVDIGGEPYAFPLARVHQALRISASELHNVDGRRQSFRFEGQEVNLVSAHQLLQLERPQFPEDIPVIILKLANGMVGLAVDDFITEKLLVVQPLDSRLGTLRNISAAAISSDGQPVLIIDVDDMIRSAEQLLEAGNLQKVQPGANAVEKPRKSVLVVDDSLTVRELERKLLKNLGYDVTVAVDGVDGWNTLRENHFDLVITDVDMPRMDGIELVGHIRSDPRYHALPVMIVSYKDREADRQRGLSAGADYYLTKASFHDQSMIQAVKDLLGEADA